VGGRIREDSPYPDYAARKVFSYASRSNLKARLYFQSR
jgi:hypothetical protein